MVGNTLAESYQSISLLLGPEWAGRDERRRMWRFGPHSSTQIDPASNRIDSHDFAGAGFATWIVRLVPHSDLVFLVRIDVVAENVRSLLLAHLAAKLNGADRLAILDQ